MSAVRDGRWDLLGYDSDPVPAAAEGLDEIIRHYQDIAAAMTEQAALLKKIGDGEERLLKGQAADAMRKRARESAGSLDKAAGRYADVRDAIVGYRPALASARSETGTALAAAEDAQRALGSAEGMPDPVNEERPEDAPPLTPQERQDSSDRSAAIGRADSALADARTRATNALGALQAAAESAAARIRENWGSDGLHTSGWDAFVFRLNQVLKKLVEILGYIGIALAVLAVLIPGLGLVTLLGVVVTVASTVFSLVLAAQGEGSWLSVILGVVSLGLVGVGAIATKALKGAQGAGLTGGRALEAAWGRVHTLKNLKDFIRTGGGIFRVPRRPVPGSWQAGVERDLGTWIANLERWTQFAGRTSVKPPWWQVTNPRYWQVEASRFKDVFAGNWRWDRVIGLNDINDLGKINATIGNLLGSASSFPVRWWMYVGPAAFSFGWFTSLWGQAVTPTNFGPDDLRSSFDWWKDADYSGLYSENPV
ncbi:hypothetical protein [Myceligenerans indicum]|uniref:Uncharacterized protein n=1 Tax=Myceligenerans indicum TaxID=2593663 RepID=A0ABS1LK23_9MICO|nr:hypothetical protein [Myceligenerans indicum]MBL0886556.1 hypothetical protein [Myceligenerans indicum]